MATDKYTFQKDLRPFGGGTPVAYPLDPAVTGLAQGEFVAWASSSKTLLRFVRAGEAGKYVGISRDSQIGVAKLGNQAALQAAITPFSVFTTGVHEVLGTAGETYAHSNAVYMSGTNTQKITLVAGGGVQVGTVHLPDGSTRVGAVNVPILIDEYTKTQG